MSISVDFDLGSFKAAGAKRSEPMPKKAMEAARDASLKPVYAEIDRLEKQLAGMKPTDPSYSYVEEALDKANGKLGHDISKISGEEGRKLLLKGESRKFWEADAGHAKTACKNATLWSIGYGYATHLPMQGFLTDVPKDKKVTFNVICSPSSHAGVTDAEKKKNFEDFARNNEYVAEIYFIPAGKSDWERALVTREKFKVKTGPEYATMSPDMTVDLSKYKGGKLVIEGSAVGSAGVEGYVEARRTVIQL